MQLTPKQKKYLRTRVHALRPVVIIGNKGVTDSVAKETASALDHHELIKVKISVGDRVQRGLIAQQLAEKTDSALVQTLGRMIALYRSSAANKIQFPKN